MSTKSSSTASDTADQGQGQRIIACIDGSRAAPAVCDYAAWASRQMDVPVTLLHVLSQERYPVAPDLAGNIGLGSREYLLEELAALDERRSKLALEHGNHLLEEAERRITEAGATNVVKRQRHGDLTESLLALENQTRLLVMGLHGESSSGRNQHIGSQLETVIRRVQRPILLVPDTFTAPRAVMVAFDGSRTAFRIVELMAASPLFRGMPVHFVMVGHDTTEHQEQLAQAKAILSEAGVEITLAIRQGEVEPTLHAYQQEHDIDVLIMGAYGHSRIRQFLVGSTTTIMLKTATTPLIILR